MRKELKNLNRISEPSLEFEDKLWQRLEAELPQKTKQAFNKLALAGTLASLVIMLGSTSAYAYVSPQVTPDSQLYRVKTGIEQVQERFYRSPFARARFHNKMAERRFQEMRFAKSDEAIKRLDERMQKMLEANKQELLKEINDPAKKEQIIEKLNKLKKMHEQHRQEMLQSIQSGGDTSQIREKHHEEMMQFWQQAAK